MYSLEVETEFSAAHAIVLHGVREVVHGHNWHVQCEVEGPVLDPEGLLCDFHALESALAKVTAPFRNADLNMVPPFDAVNPTAEHVAKHIAEELIARLPNGVRLACVRVTEAPRCVAVYRPTSHR